MGKMVFLNAAVTINNVNLSDHVESVTLETDVDAVEVTAMGDGGKRRLAGLQDSKLTVSFWQDYAAAKVDATMWAIVQGGTGVAFKVAAAGTSYSATNPAYSGTVILTQYQPLAGKVGDGLSSDVTFTVDGTIASGTS